ncbi:MAG: hypothetical protein K1X28_02745 [Parachlamydiales bacterium]|nr:hypothetical protein [Parachlamydiales bacterium]
MKGKSIFGIALIVIGAIMLFFSDYIAGQVAQGKLQIQSAQSQVDTADTLFKQSEYTKPVGKIFTGGAQRKIDEGQAQVDYYEGLSSKLKIFGIILIVAGAGVLFIGRKKG